ncbi:hypothetical protein MIZ03_3070 [Rhodoferax lithotrophicus]|uniref:Uncharacterized protein n=1 Tax=Rhodoferax lithotrophicus TaxID=2798804 RepID=A0ABN6D8V4_9BURK|nr:hypothetical protein MIZ03_3070 [Rhodoferax sp. MIZ03]
MLDLVTPRVFVEAHDVEEKSISMAILFGGLLMSGRVQLARQ